MRKTTAKPEVKDKAKKDDIKQDGKCIGVMPHRTPSTDQQRTFKARSRENTFLSKLSQLTTPHNPNTETKGLMFEPRGYHACVAEAGMSSVRKRKL